MWDQPQGATDGAAEQRDVLEVGVEHPSDADGQCRKHGQYKPGDQASSHKHLARKAPDCGGGCAGLPDSIGYLRKCG
ncbi:hypothetical protein GCM10023168_12730 [Fodinibacter luteus]|uniref:Uncharacterized protein n=1 Tax=Fodinibacter luteus TaxID=552064 RepID=A0ABP8KA67_9MICO